MSTKENNFKTLKKQESKNKKEVESDVIGVRKIAVLPFTDLTKKNREIAEIFPEKLASQMVQSQMFDVKYPKEVIEILLELGINKELKDFDNEMNLLLGRKLGVDAMIFGEVKEVDLYSPTRISFSLKMFIVESGKYASVEEVWDLSSFGVPVHHISRNDWNRFSSVWSPQNVYDTNSKDLQKRIKKYAKDFDVDDRAFGWQYIIQSNDRFLEFISDEIVESLKISVNPKYLKKSGLWHKIKHMFRDR